MTSMKRERLEELLAGLVRSGGTSLHLSAGNGPWVRLAGRAVPTGDTPTEATSLATLAGELLFADQLARIERGEEIDVVWASNAGVRFRVSALNHADGLGLVFRRLPDSAPRLADYELPELLSAFTAMRRGLVLVTGPFGSGKSTTLAAMVARIDEERAVNIVTLERRIEFVHACQNAVIHQREVGTHVATVADGVREAFLIGADVVMVGEIVSADDLRAVLEAAEGGMLVLAGFEASSIVSAVSELPRLAPSMERANLQVRFADSLRAIIGQTLIRRRHGRGKVPLLEILVRNEPVARAIRRGRAELLPGLMAEGLGLGMQTAEQGLRRLMQRHVISEEEVQQHAARRMAMGQFASPSRV